MISIFKIRLNRMWLGSEWVGFNGTSTQFRSLAPSVTRKADTESPIYNKGEPTLYRSCQRYINLPLPLTVHQTVKAIKQWQAVVKSTKFGKLAHKLWCEAQQTPPPAAVVKVDHETRRYSCSTEPKASVFESHPLGHCACNVVYESTVNSEKVKHCWQCKNAVSPSHNKMSNWQWQNTTPKHMLLPLLLRLYCFQ